MHCWRPAQWMNWVQARKHFPKPHLHEKKCHGKCLVVCCLNWSTTPFWTPVKLLHLRSMLRSMRCIKNCKACSQDWSTERAQFFSMTMPHLTSHITNFKSWTNSATTFCLICHIHLTSCQPLSTSSSNLMSFWRKNASTTSRMKKILSKSLWYPEAWIFLFVCFVIGINKLISHWQNVLILIVPILINKDMYEPSYNDL